MSRHTFDRKQPKFAQKKRFLIVVEGAVTECQYFNAIRTLRRISTANIKVIPPGPTSPIEIVEKAIQLRKKSSHSGDPYDEVWCVFDAEAKLTQTTRPGYADALIRANQQKVKVANSNPCFELWILLHHEDCTAWIASHAVQQSCSRLNLVDGKQIRDVDQILRLHDTARQRAIVLTAMHDRNGTNNPVNRNPESTVYKLTEAIFQAFPA